MRCVRCVRRTGTVVVVELCAAGRFRSISDRGMRLGEELVVLGNLLDEATGLLECSEGPVAEEALQLLQRESELIRQQISLREEKEARIDARFREAERVRLFEFLLACLSLVCPSSALCLSSMVRCAFVSRFCVVAHWMREGGDRCRQSLPPMPQETRRNSARNV